VTYAKAFCSDGTYNFPIPLVFPHSSKRFFTFRPNLELLSKVFSEKQKAFTENIIELRFNIIHATNI
jgi:hypothetical protein